MSYVDLTRAILIALANKHPRGIRADELAVLVNCERAALQRPLRLLKATGAIRCAKPKTSSEAGVEVRITEEAMLALGSSKARSRR